MMKNRILALAALMIITIAAAYGQKMNVATYNVRFDSAADSVKGNGWLKRYPFIAKLVQFHDFDIFGTQEGKFHQLNHLKDSLPGYTFIGAGRDDGKTKGEFSAIFYKTDKFKLLEHGDFWLSTITDRPNKGWDAALPRICTWGLFQDKKTGFKFYMYNLHMDHVGVIARRESSKLILDKIRNMKTTVPVILTGDFNIDQDNESYKLLNTSSILRDSYELSAIKYAPNATYNDFTTTKDSKQRIDHIFLTKQFKVLRYGILTDSYFGGRTPSDHNAVMIQVEYK